MLKKRISRTNIQVKEDMYKALLKLIKKKPFSAISVSDITSEAKVSRMSFYRNYNTIEDILLEHLKEVVEKYKLEKIEDSVVESEKAFQKIEYITHCFEFFYAQHEFIDALISAGMGDMFLAKITEHFIKIWLTEENTTRKNLLKISAYAGSIYNMYREWSKDGFVELPEEVAEIFCDLRK